MRIQEAFPDGKFVSQEEYLIRCPFCGDHPRHNHCYINVEKGVFNCRLCGEDGKVQRLFGLAGGDAYAKVEPEKAEIRKKKPIDFSCFPPVLGEVNMVDVWALSYLAGRGITKREAREYDIRYAAWGKWDNRVIFPIYEKGKVVCWAARALFPDMEPKYRYPSRGESARTASEVLFPAFEGHAEHIVLVEGIFDAISLSKKLPRVSFKPVSILGKNMSWFQRKMLLGAKTETVFIMLDADASDDIVKIAKDLSGYGRDIMMCFLERGDPASASKDEVEGAILNAVKYFYGYFEIERKCTTSRK